MSTTIYQFDDDNLIAATITAHHSEGWTVDMPSTVTNYPVDSDAERSDHYQPQARTYRVNMTQSAAHGVGAADLQNMRTFLDGVRRGRARCAIEHPRYGVALPVMLEALTVTMTTNLGQLEFATTWKEVEIAESSDVLISNRPSRDKVTEDAAQCTDEEDQGGQPTTEKPPATALAGDDRIGTWPWTFLFGGE